MRAALKFLVVNSQCLELFFVVSQVTVQLVDLRGLTDNLLLEHVYFGIGVGTRHGLRDLVSHSVMSYRNALAAHAIGGRLYQHSILNTRPSRRHVRSRLLTLPSISIRLRML